MAIRSLFLWCRISLIAPLLVSACNSGIPPRIDPIGGKTFWALKIDPDSGTGTTYAVAALFSGQSRYANAYVEVGNNDVSQSDVDFALKEFDRNIAAKQNALFAPPMDVNKDGRVTLLFLDIQDGFDGAGNSGYIAGYYDARNQFEDQSVYDATGLRSNETEMLYLDTYPSNVRSTEFLATLAHEYQHLLNFSYKYELGILEDTWINEGLSEVASDICGYGPQTGRISTFDNVSGDSLVVWSGDVIDYAHVYMYMRYLMNVYGENGIRDVFRYPGTGVAALSAVFENGGESVPPNQFNCLAGTPQNERFLCSYASFWASVLGFSSVDFEYENLAPQAVSLPAESETVAGWPLTDLPALGPIGTIQFGPVEPAFYAINRDCGSCPGVSRLRFPSSAYTVLFGNSIENNYSTITVSSIRPGARDLPGTLRTVPVHLNLAAGTSDNPEALRWE